MATNETISVDTALLELEHVRQVNCSFSNALAFAGHELKNGLQRLSLTVERYRYRCESLGPQQQQMIADMTHNIMHLQKMAANCMRLAHIQDGQFEIHPTSVDPLAQLIEPLVEENRELLAERAQTCEVEECPVGLTMWADADLLLSVADNLLSNAIKYGDHGGKIVIRLTARSDGLDEPSVWNSGQGISAVDQERIFECFETGDRRSIRQGNGIGLYLARRIAEAHHGYLTCESEPGAWARFSCLLPQHEAKPPNLSIMREG